jgi:hypothetical protein
MNPMAIARRPSKLVPVIAVVVVMFFVAVYRWDEMPRRERRCRLLLADLA